MENTEDKKLTPKQQKFVDCYTGNATEAASMAGYKGNPRTLAAIGSENLRKPNIAKAIADRLNTVSNNVVADRLTRQAFWTKVMRDEREDMKTRLAASRLLGQSENDFINQHEKKTFPEHEQWVLGLQKTKE